MNKYFVGCALAALTVLASGCAQYENKRGVLEQWQGGSQQEWNRGNLHCSRNQDNQRAKYNHGRDVVQQQ